MEQISCKICNKTADSDAKLIGNWPEIIKQIKFLFKIDLPDCNKNDSGICNKCEEKLKGIQEFYDMIIKARDQLIEAQVTKVVPEKSRPIRRKRNKSLQESIELSLESIENNSDDDENEENTHTSLERRQQIATEDIKISQFFSLSCPECSSTVFNTFASYKQHMTKKHQISRPVIICCKQRLGRRCRLLEHMSYHLHPDDFKCPECARQFTSKDRINNHFKQIHGPKENLTYQCDKCERRFRAFAGLKAHLLTHLSKEEKETLRTHFCDYCDSKFISKFLLLQHKKQVHIKPDRYVCDICAKVYKSKAQFLYHYKMNHREKVSTKVQCKLCKRICLNEVCLKAHMKTVHSDDGPHICDICKKQSPSSRALKSHKLYVHESKRKFLCTYCDKAFKKELELKEHLTVHLGGALYACQFCDKTFNSSANMYSHRKRTHPEEHKKLQDAKKGNI